MVQLPFVQSKLQLEKKSKIGKQTISNEAFLYYFLSTIKIIFG